MMQETVKVRSVGDSVVITIPRPLLDALGWQRGDRVVVDTNGIRGGGGVLTARPERKVGR